LVLFRTQVRVYVPAVGVPVGTFVILKTLALFDVTLRTYPVSVSVVGVASTGPLGFVASDASMFSRNAEVAPM
jgi:hypothetical protein